MRAPLLVAAALALTALTFAPAPAAAQGGDLWTLPDGADDVHVQDPTTPAVPTTAATQHVDLRSIRIVEETPVGLRLAFTFADLQQGDGTIYFGPANNQVMRLGFTLDGAPIKYELHVVTYHPVETPAVGFSTELGDHALCLRAGDSECFYAPVEAWIDHEENQIGVWLPKASLLGRFDYRYGQGTGPGHGGQSGTSSPPPGTPTNLAVGAVLKDFAFLYEPDQKSDLTPTPLYEIAPDSGAAPTFAFRHPAANVVIAMDEDVYGPVEPGQTTTLSVLITNHGTTKRLVQFTHEIVGDAQEVSKYAIEVPESLQVPAAETRNLSVRVTTDPGALGGAGVQLILVGQSLGIPGELAYGTINLFPSVSLGPEHPELFLHGKGWGEDSPFNDVVCLFGGGCGYGWINTAQHDPDADADLALRPYHEFYDPTHIEAEFPSLWANPPLAKPVALEGGKPVEFHLKLRAPAPLADVLVDALLLDGARGVIAHAEGPVDVGTDAAEVVLSVVPSADTRVLGPEVGFWELFIKFKTTVANPPGFAGQSLVELVLEGSKVRLSLVEPPELLEQGTPNAPIRLDVGGDRDQFVNPGEARLFNVTAIHVGTDPDTVRIRADLDAPGWSVELLPGANYRLEPGATVTFGVLVRAPPDAAEGATATIRLNATTDGLPDERGFLLLHAIATNGIDLPDDSNAFRPDEEAQQRVVDDGKGGGSPGPGAVALLVILSMFAWRARRRSGPGAV